MTIPKLTGSIIRDSSFLYAFLEIDGEPVDFGNAQINGESKPVQTSKERTAFDLRNEIGDALIDLGERFKSGRINIDLT